jgi:hypothetical protein
LTISAGARVRIGLVLLGAVWVRGCLLVVPLEDDPIEASGGRGGSGGQSDGGDAGDQGDGASGGTAGGSSGRASGGASGEASGGTSGKGGTAGSATIGSPCVSNAECIERGATGAPYRCSEEGRCVALKTGICPLVYDAEAAGHENPIYVGAFAALPPAEPETSYAVYPFRLALGEVSGDAQGGLVMPNGERRPIVLIVCNNCASEPESSDSCPPSVIDEAMTHLVDDVGVQAVLATLLPGDLRRVFEDYEDRDLFFLSPAGATSSVTTLDDEDRVWTMLGQPRDLATVYRDLVAQTIEPYLRDVRGIGARAIRVALLRGSDAFGLELSSLVASELEWNGKSASENGTDYVGFTFDTLSPAEVAESLLEFVPDLVISTAGDEVTRAETGVISLLERQWSAFVAEPGAPLPFYVLSPFNAGSLNPVVRLLEDEMLGADAEPTHRFVGITAAGAEDPGLNNQFALNLRDAFPSANSDTGNFYDAFYFLSYAIYAARRDAPGGKDIARGMRRLLEGPAYEVGLADIAPAMEVLEDETATIELNGTLGPPVFDKSGTHVDPGAVYCFLASGSGVSVYPDALRYDRPSATFKGTFPCFDDFQP